MHNKEEASKKACEKIREVFKESIEKHPLGKDFKSEDDNVLIEEFTDQWTWYMQGWLDADTHTK